MTQQIKTYKMKTFNLRRYSNGNIVKTVKADTLQKAKTELELKGYDCQDDFFLEDSNDTTKESTVQPYRSTYTANYQSEY